MSSSSSPAPKLLRLRLSLSLPTSSTLLIFPLLPTPTMTIKDLYPLLSPRLSIPRIVELRLDGYLLNGNDKVVDVLREDDTIQAVDYASYAAEIQGKCTVRWIRNIQSDWNEDNYPFCDGGVVSNEKDLWIQSGVRRSGKDEVTCVEIVDYNTLLSSKNGKLTILKDHNGDGNDFIGEILVDNTTNIFTLLTHCKTSTTDRHAISEIKFKLDKSRSKVIKIGSSAEIQSCYQGRVESKYNIPLPEIKGEKYPEPVEGKTGGEDGDESWEDLGAASPSTPTKLHNSLQSIDLCRTQLQFHQKKKISCAQDWARNGRITHTLSLHCDVINQDGNDWMFTSVVSEYCNSEGKWMPGNRTMMKSYEDGRWGNGDEAFTIPSKSPMKLILGMVVDCEGKQMDRNNRLYHTFPSPFLFRFKLLESTGQSIVLHCDYRNSSPYPPIDTKEKRLLSHVSSYTDCEVFPWIWNQVDDTVAEGRAWILGTYCIDGKQGDRRWQLQSSLNSSTSYMRESDFKKLVWQAGRTGVNEMKIAEWSAEKSDLGHTMVSTALIDLSLKQVYAVRVELGTNSGAAKQTYSLYSYGKQAIAKK